MRDLFFANEQHKALFTRVVDSSGIADKYYLSLYYVLAALPHPNQYIDENLQLTEKHLSKKLPLSEHEKLLLDFGLSLYSCSSKVNVGEAVTQWDATQLQVALEAIKIRRCGV